MLHILSAVARAFSSVGSHELAARPSSAAAGSESWLQAIPHGSEDACQAAWSEIHSAVPESDRCGVCCAMLQRVSRYGCFPWAMGTAAGADESIRPSLINHCIVGLAERGEILRALEILDQHNPKPSALKDAALREIALTAFEGGLSTTCARLLNQISELGVAAHVAQEIVARTDKRARSIDALATSSRMTTETDLVASSVQILERWTGQLVARLRTELGSLDAVAFKALSDAVGSASSRGAALRSIATNRGLSTAGSLNDEIITTEVQLERTRRAIT